MMGFVGVCILMVGWWIVSSIEDLSKAIRDRKR
jgi:hypothetical protein